MFCFPVFILTLFMFSIIVKFLHIIVNVKLSFDRSRHLSTKCMLRSVLCLKLVTISVNRSEYLDYQLSLKEQMLCKRSKVKSKSFETVCMLNV